MVKSWGWVVVAHEILLSALGLGVVSILDSRFSILDSRFSILDSRFSILDSIPRSQVTSPSPSRLTKIGHSPSFPVVPRNSMSFHVIPRHSPSPSPSPIPVPVAWQFLPSTCPWKPSHSNTYCSSSCQVTSTALWLPKTIYIYVYKLGLGLEYDILSCAWIWYFAPPFSFLC